MEQLGLIQREPNPYFACRGFCVPKGNGKLRFVIDMRPLNKIVERIVSNLPNLEMQLSWLERGTKYFGSLDHLSGFDMLRVIPEHTKYLCVSTVFGVYRLLFAPQGFLNSPTIYQDRVISSLLGGTSPGSLFGNSVAGCNQWIDDSQPYAKTFSQYLAVLRTLLTNCIKWNVRLNIMKCTFLTDQVEWCGRIINKNGWRYNSKYFNSILKVPAPTTLGALEDFLYTITWLNLTIPKLTSYKGPLESLCNTLKSKAVSRTGRLLNRKSRRNIPIPPDLWTESLSGSYNVLLSYLRVSAETNFSLYSRQDHLVLLTDASEPYWSAILGQISKDHTLPVDGPSLLESPLRPMFFLAGKFSGSSYRWSIPQKELYAVVHSLKRLNFLCHSHPGGIKLFSDHKNLFYLLNPVDLTNRLSSFSRLHRWVLSIQEFLILVTHVGTDFNLFADLLSRWGYFGKPLVGDSIAHLPTLLHSGQRSGNDLIFGNLTLLNGVNTLPDSFSQPPTAPDQQHYSLAVHTRSQDSVMGQGTVLSSAKPSRNSKDRALKTIRQTVRETGLDLSNQPQSQQRSVKKTLSPKLPTLHHGEVDDWNAFLNDRISFLSPDYNGKWKKITLQELKERQLEEKPHPRVSADQDGVLRTDDNRIWIPTSLVTRLIIQVHIITGHGNITEQFKYIKDSYYLQLNHQSLKEALLNLKRFCLHCDKHPALVRRPLHELPHGSKPNQVLYADYCFPDTGTAICAIVDDFSRATLLKCTDSADAFTFAQCLLEWKAHRGLDRSVLLCTDQGSHFCNSLIQCFQKALGYSHRLSVAYSPFCNSTAETSNRLIWKYLKPLSSQI